MKLTPLFVLTLLAAALVVLGHGAALPAFVVCAPTMAWGVGMYWQHDWFARMGMPEFATPCVVGLGAVLAFVVAFTGSLPVFAVAASVPVMVVGLRMVRARLPIPA